MMKLLPFGVCSLRQIFPSDITGVMIFDTETNRFHFRRGPVFAYIVLVDEINRTSPKVQAALLESMAEGQVTVDNISYALDDLFFVIATQNPLDSVGTYPLPLAQLDRFLFKIRMDHVARDAELEVLSQWGKPREKTSLPRVFRGDIIESRRLLREGVMVSERVHECLVDIARSIRNDPRVAQGVSTRSLVLAIPAASSRFAARTRLCGTTGYRAISCPFVPPSHRYDSRCGIRGSHCPRGHGWPTRYPESLDNSQIRYVFGATTHPHLDHLNGHAGPGRPTRSNTR